MPMAGSNVVFQEIDIDRTGVRTVVVAEEAQIIPPVIAADELAMFAKGLEMRPVETVRKRVHSIVSPLGFQPDVKGGCRDGLSEGREGIIKIPDRACSPGLANSQSCIG